MIYLELFFGFLRVGCFAFGGAYGAIPLIRDVVLSYGWLDDEALSCMIAVSESTPGPIMVNLATYDGSSQAGLPGAVIATTAVVLPSFLVILLVTAVLKTLLHHRYVQAVLGGLKPCMAGIILATGVTMILGNLTGPAERAVVDLPSVDLPSVILMALLGGILLAVKKIRKKKLSPITTIIVSAVLGMVVYGFG